MQKKNKSLSVGEVPVTLGNHPGYRGDCWPDSRSVTFQSRTRMLNPVLYSSDGESTVNQEAMASSSSATTLRLPRVRTKLVTQHMARRGSGEEDKEIAQSDRYKI